MMIKSNVQRKVLEAGYKNIQHFSREAKMNRPSIDRIWEGDISNRALKTLLRVAIVLDCKVDDLFVIDNNGAAN